MRVYEILKARQTVAAITFALFLCLGLLAPGPALARGGLLLDPGHSPQKPGAMSCAGQPEYVYNDALAGYISDFLTKKGIAHDLTRTKEENPSLAARAKQSAGHDLFISLHHDSVQPQFLEKINGLPVSRKARGYSIFVSRKNPFFEESLAHARRLGQTLRRKGLTPSTHHGEKIKGENREILDSRLGIYAFDDLVVLKQAKTPALLFEAAVLVHPEDEKLARADRFKKIIAEAVQNAIGK